MRHGDIGHFSVGGGEIKSPNVAGLSNDARTVYLDIIQGYVGCCCLVDLDTARRVRNIDAPASIDSPVDCDKAPYSLVDVDSRLAFGDGLNDLRIERRIPPGGKDSDCVRRSHALNPDGCGRCPGRSYREISI